MKNLYTTDLSKILESINAPTITMDELEAMCDKEKEVRIERLNEQSVEIARKADAKKVMEDLWFAANKAAFSNYDKAEKILAQIKVVEYDYRHTFIANITKRRELRFKLDKLHAAYKKFMKMHDKEYKKYEQLKAAYDIM